MERTCRSVPLSKQPLVMVLGQVRFSKVRLMGDYLPAIQDIFRRNGFPVEREVQSRQIVVNPQGGKGAFQAEEQRRWEYSAFDGLWMALVTEDSVVLQTTDYKAFEDFAEKLELLVRTVLECTEHDEFGVIERVGLRYVDAYKAVDGKGFRDYLAPGLHGLSDSAFLPNSNHTHTDSVGRTDVGEKTPGTMVVRVTQNNQGFSLPPELIGTAPPHNPRSKVGELLTLIDMDHYIEGRFKADPKWVIEKAYIMHDHLIETFHKNVVTDAAIAEWK